MRPFAPLLCVLALALVACGDDDEDSGSGGSGGGSARDEPEEPSAAEQPAEGGCKDVPQPEPRPDGGAKRPTGRLEPGTTYVVTLRTSCGEIAIRLDQKTSPRTTASFAHLAVVDEIGRLGDPASGGTGTPLQPVVIVGAEVSER